MTHQRDRIHDQIADQPGTHFNALTRTLDLATGQVQYHLKTLQRENRVVAEQLYGRTHYYTPDYDPWERAAIAVLRRETARDIAIVLLDDGPSSPAAVADALDIARSTLEWHLDHLVAQGLVRKERDSADRVTLVPERPEETVRLLRLVAPSATDRLVDRFTRLVDGLLAGGESPEE
jgi:predicted transcriptional regulator